MSWLPAVRVAGSRWWLPLSHAASDLIASAMVGEDVKSKELADQMRRDPALAIFAVSVYPRSASPVPLESVAAHFLANVVNHFAPGDAFLGVPGNRERFAITWSELRDAFLRIPVSQWACHAAQWLGVTGEHFPMEIVDRWPSLADEAVPMIVPEGEGNVYAPSRLDLAVLARRLRRERMMSQSFNASLNAAKLASLKQFAYGLSHEINNPLANISVRAGGLLRDEPDANRQISLQRIVDQAMRAHEMVADLMFYAHPPEPHRQEVELTGILIAVVQQTRSSIADRGIELIVLNADSPLLITADRPMILEAVRALVRNAIEAIGIDGRVELSYGAKSIGGKKMAIIQIADSGPGLSEEARKHAFDPYFSGRESGRGLGVGLCRVQRIATLHGGSVSLQSGIVGCTARLWIATTGN